MGISIDPEDLFIDRDMLANALRELRSDFNQRVSEVRTDAINASTEHIRKVAEEQATEAVSKIVYGKLKQFLDTVSKEKGIMEDELNALKKEIKDLIDCFDTLSASRALPEKIKINTTLRY